MGIFDRLFGKKNLRNDPRALKNKEKKSLYSNSSAVAEAERNAMAKEDLKEAILSLVKIYNECKGPQFVGLSNYYAGKFDACGIVENHLKGESLYTVEYLENWKKYDATRVGDEFNRGRWEVLSWALSRLYEKEYLSKKE